jgi:CRISPR-associated protein Cas2
MVVIVYDIADNKRLSKVARYMEKNGVRVQRSVFEIDKTPKEATKIFNGLKDLIEKKEDKCFMFEFNSKEDLQANTDIERIF